MGAQSRSTQDPRNIVTQLGETEASLRSLHVNGDLKNEKMSRNCAKMRRKGIPAQENKSMCKG